MYEPDCCVMSSSFPTHPPNKEERRPKDGVVKENQAEGTANGGVQQLTRSQAAGGFRGSAGDGRGRSRRFSNSRSGGRGGAATAQATRAAGVVATGGHTTPHAERGRGNTSRRQVTQRSRHARAAGSASRKTRLRSRQHRAARGVKRQQQVKPKQPAASAATGSARRGAGRGERRRRRRLARLARGYHGLGVRERPLRRSGETPHASAPGVLNLWAEYRARAPVG